MSGVQPYPGMGAYSPSKAALVMLVRQLAQGLEGSVVDENRAAVLPVRERMEQHRKNATCAACHADANARFVQYDPHPNPRDYARTPALWWANRFYWALIPTCFLFFGVHSGLWFWRSRQEQRGHRKHAGRMRNDGEQQGCFKQRGVLPGIDGAIGGSEHRLRRVHERRRACNPIA